MTAKQLLNKLKKLSKDDLEKPIYYCDMSVKKVLVCEKEISLR